MKPHDSSLPQVRSALNKGTTFRIDADYPVSAYYSLPSRPGLTFNTTPSVDLFSLVPTDRVLPHNA